MALQRREEWFDRAWWDSRLYSATAVASPSLCNLRVTLAHYELSLALRSVLGQDSGPNFHTWAVWGSKKAGTTIRREDIPSLQRLASILGGAVGLATAKLMQPAGRSGARRAITAGMAMAFGAFAARAISGTLLEEASREILGGNVTVLDDIGPITARFVCAFHDQHAPDPQRLGDCLSALRLGPSDAGGQALLKEAFTHYYHARYEADFDKRHEHILMANLYAILHEHMRLEPHIDGAIPRPLRKAITAHLLCFQLGESRLTVGEDVPKTSSGRFPDVFECLDNHELVRFLTGPGGWDRTPDSLAGSAARDWSEIRDRMNYICDLFRSRYFDPGLFDAPYTGAQQASILSGRVPAGPL